MWAEIATGGTVIGMVGLIFRMQQKKIEFKVDQTSCDIHLEAFRDILEKGDKKFEKVADKLTEIGEAVVRIDERTKRTNGGV